MVTMSMRTTETQRAGRFGLVIDRVFKESDRRVDVHRSRLDIDARDDGLDEWDENFGIACVDDEKVLGREVIDPRDRADGVTVAADRQANELVVVPSVFLDGSGILVFVDPEDRLDERLGRITVVDSVKKDYGLVVVPLEFFQRDGLAHPR